jgi:hypothetical protein
MIWHKIDQRVDLGLLSMIFRGDDPRPAKKQAKDRYAHGGGWSPIPGFLLDQGNWTLSFRGDPPYKPLAYGYLSKKEIIVLYNYSFVMILQADGSFEVSRMD